MFFQEYISPYYYVYNFPYRNFNNQIKIKLNKIKIKKFSSTLFYHQLLDKMPKGIQGMINLNSNKNVHVYLKNILVFVPYQHQTYGKGYTIMEQ